MIKYFTPTEEIDGSTSTLKRRGTVMKSTTLFVELRDRAAELKSKLKMVSKVTNSEKLLGFEAELDEILPDLAAAKKPIGADAISTTGPEQKRIVALGVQIEGLWKALDGKLTVVHQQMEQLSDDEQAYLDSIESIDEDRTNDGGPEVAYESTSSQNEDTDL